MRRLRKHLSPLGSDTIAPLNLPPVRLGLLTKLNLLTVGLIFLTALAIGGWFHWQQYQDEEAALRAQGGDVLLMLGRALRARPVDRATAACLDAVLDSLSADTGIAYAIDPRRRAASRWPRAHHRAAGSRRRRRRAFETAGRSGPRRGQRLRPLDRRGTLHRAGDPGRSPAQAPPAAEAAAQGAAGAAPERRRCRGGRRGRRSDTSASA